VTVKAALPSSQNRGPEPSMSKNDGEWGVGGLAGGNWALDFVKDGYETRSISVPVRETSRLRPLEIIMTKKVEVVDPNVAIKAKLVEAAELMNSGKFPEARAIYETLQTENPEVKEFKPLIARAYYGEGNKDKAIELLREVSTADPANAEVRLLLGQLLNETGKTEEARKVLGSVTDETVTDPVVFLNLGIGLINEGKHEEALPWFTKAVTRFPDHPDSYYYRGLAYIGLGKMDEAKADLTKFIAIAKPDAPELAQAKAMLDSIK
jgi:tetratricopeptide (TPR) repeat protein